MPSARRHLLHSLGGVLLFALSFLFVSRAYASPDSRISLDLQDIEIRELVRVLGAQAGVSIYADPTLAGQASLHVENLPFEEALRAILEPRGYAFRKFEMDSGDTPTARYLVYDPASTRRLYVNVTDGLLTAEIQRFNLDDVLVEISRESGKSIVPQGSADVPITLTLRGVPLEAGLNEIARAAEFRLSRENDVYRFLPGLLEPETAAAEIAPLPPFEITRAGDGKIRLRAREANLSDVILSLAQEGGISVSLGAGLEGKASAYLEGVTPTEAIRSVSERAGMRVSEEAGSLVIAPPSTEKITIRMEAGTVSLSAYEAPVREVMTRLAASGVLSPIAFDPSVEGDISIHVSALAPREALARIADARSLRVDERGGLLRVTDPTREKRIRVLVQAGLVSMDVQNAPMSEVLREFTSRTGVNVPPTGDTLVTTSVQSLPAPAALRALAEAVGLGVVEDADRFRFVALSAAPRGRVEAKVENGVLSIDAQDADIARLADALATASGRNIVVETGASGSITGRIENVAFEPGLRSFLASKGFRLRRTGGIYRIASATSPAATPEAAAPNFEVSVENGRLTLDVTEADLGALLRQIAEEAGLDLALYGAVRDRVNVLMRDEAIETGLSKILAGTHFGHVIQDSTLIVGDISQAGSPMAALALQEAVIPLRYFSAKEVPALLPAEIPVAQIRVLEAQNSVLVLGRPEIIDKARAFLARIDRRPTQVQIEALLVEYRTTDAFTYNLSTLNITGTASNLANVSPSQGAVSFTVTDLKNFNNPQFQGALTALVERGDATVRARPSIATLTGKEARINVQSQENFRVTQPSSNQGVPLVQIQSINSGITLRITPYVSTTSDQVTLDLFIEDSSPGDRTADGLPAISTRNAQNRIVLQNDRTAVIGGLIRNDQSHQQGGLPIISQIPVIGWIFGRRATTNRNTTLVFYITPRIVEGDTTVAESFAQRGVLVEPEALAPLLPIAPTSPEQI